MTSYFHSLQNLDNALPRQTSSDQDHTPAIDPIPPEHSLSLCGGQVMFMSLHYNGGLF